MASIMLRPTGEPQGNTTEEAHAWVDDDAVNFLHEARALMLVFTFLCLAVRSYVQHGR